MNVVIIIKNLKFILTPLFFHDGPEGWTRWNDIQSRYYHAVNDSKMEKEAEAYIVTINKYYGEKGIQIGGRLANDIRIKNPTPLAYVAYLVKNLLDVKGVEKLLKDVSDIEKDGNVGARIYHNQLNEINGIFFVHRVLGQNIQEVESNENKVFSPNRQGDKSCDIKAEDNGTTIFYESKDSSKEIVSRRPEGEFLGWTPLNNGQIKAWIKEMLSRSDEKGADALLCKVPMWTKMGLPDDVKKYDEWAKSVFPDAIQLGPERFTISFPDLDLRYTKRFFINKLDEAIRFDVVSS